MFAARLNASARNVLQKHEVGQMVCTIPLEEREIVVWVRRQWSDYRDAAYRLSDVWNFHWSRVSGGVHALAPRAFVNAYVMCNAMIEGELAHSCRHGPGPHEIKVCVIRNSNKEIWPLIERLAGPRLAR
jgi:hypothetical protein